MTPRILRARVPAARLVLSALLSSTLLAQAPVARADDVPDTTAPQVRLNPCYDATSCRRVYAEVWGDLEPGDDLAVLGARIGDQVLAEHVFDDGTGFHPYGGFFSYGNDVGIGVDYALSVEAPPGAHDITFYARDLAGNTSELTTTVLGPVPPGPVRRLTAQRVGAHGAFVRWAVPNLKGDCCAEYVVTTRGHAPKEAWTAPPSYGYLSVSYGRLSRGWHRFTVRATTHGGTGPSRSVRVFIPRHTHR